MKIIIFQQTIKHNDCHLNLRLQIKLWFKNIVHILHLSKRKVIQ